MSIADTNNLYRSLFKLYRQMFRLAYVKMHGKHEIYRGQAGLLLIISKNDGASQRELAEQLDVRPPSMTEMISKMELTGLITRKQDEKDRRVMRIYLTENGKIAAGSLAGTEDAFLSSIFDTLTEEEREQMLAITKKLYANIEAMNLTKEVIYHEDNEFHHSNPNPNLGSDDEDKHHGNGHNHMPSYLL